MRDVQQNGVVLKTYADRTLLHLTTAFVENAAVGMGLEREQALSLTLAAEEVFAYLCALTSPDCAVEIQCQAGGFFVQVAFGFWVEDFEMRAFNLTSTVSLHDKAGLKEMGLVIASRLVDRFEIEEEDGQNLKLLLVKEKAYPPWGDEPAVAARHLAEFHVREAGREELKLFAVLINQCYGLKIIPGFLNYPGKLVDMVQSGRYRTALAVGPGGQVGGGMVWRWQSERTVECYGPYVFNQGPQSSMAARLVEACLESVARTPALGIVNSFPTEDLPEGYFESVGDVFLVMPDGSRLTRNVCFRQIHEDPGSFLWSHPLLQDFLLKACERLVLPREIRLVSDRGENRSRFSVLAATSDSARNQVTLRAIRSGTDCRENVSKHLALFREEAIRNVFFVMDLGHASQVHFTPALFETGFEPCFLLPNEGAGDLAVFQHKDASE